MAEIDKAEAVFDREWATEQAMYTGLRGAKRSSVQPRLSRVWIRRSQLRPSTASSKS
jgi:hypothetical protein